MEVERMCAVCRQKRVKSELLRIAKSADGKISVDKSNKLPGRGMYICRFGECIKNAERRHTIERAFKTSGEEVKNAYIYLSEYKQDDNDSKSGDVS